MAKIGDPTPAPTCCTTTKYSGVIEGDLPTGAVKVMMLAFSSSQKYLPLGETVDIVDVAAGLKKIITGLITFTMSGVGAYPAFEMLVRKAIAETVTGVTWDMVSISDITSSATTATTTANGGRRLSAPTVTVSYKIMAPAEMAITASDISAASLKLYLTTFAADAGVSLPTISNTIVSAPLAGASFGTPKAASWATPIASLALTPLIAVVLALFW
jgi:hypothetical protein